MENEPAHTAPTAWWKHRWRARLAALALLAIIWQCHGRALLMSPSPIGEVTLTWGEMWPLGAQLALYGVLVAAVLVIPGWFRLTALAVVTLVVISGLTATKLRNKREGQLRLAAEMAAEDPIGAADLRRTVEETAVLPAGKLLSLSLFALSVLVLTCASLPRSHGSPNPVPPSSTT